VAGEQKWQANKGPGPGYMQYIVHITPGPRGTFIFCRCNSIGQLVTWTETFTPDEVELAKFYGLLVEKGLFTRKLKSRQEVMAGDAQERLALTISGRDYSIPAQLDSEEAALASEIYTAFETLVPPEIWAKFIAEHEQNRSMYALFCHNRKNQT
jgi:hypothetical protein